jgi:hypothetical protein
VVGIHDEININAISVFFYLSALWRQSRPALVCANAGHEPTGATSLCKKPPSLFPVGSIALLRTVLFFNAEFAPELISVFSVS